MAPQKRLSWEEWQRRANADYVKGEFGVQQMVSSWGYPEGMSAETHKIEFDKGKAKRKNRAGRRIQRAKYNAKRQTAATSQTIGKDVYGKGVLIPKGSGLREHHKRIITVYAPFFEGLNPKETEELAQWFVDEGFPLGNVEANLEAATKIQHDAIHEWTRDNFIESNTNKPLLSFKNYTLNERLVPALTFLEQVQPAVDEKLAEIKKGVQQKPSSRLMPKTGQPVDPELVSQFSRQISNRINRRLGKSPFDETLDTTSQKYLENIGKYQQFIDLDEASKAALGLYGENVKQYYADLNRQLRSGSTANLTPQQIAINEFLQENLTKAIDVLPSEQRNLYRAIKDPAREGLTNLKVGDVYTDKGFGSFSADEKAALRFIRKDAPSALIAVQNAAGTNIGPVMEFDESEFLQKPGAQYRLESIDEVFSPKTGGTVPNYKFTQVTNKPTVTAKGGTKGLMSKLGPISAGLAIGGALLSDNPAEAIPVAAETLTPLGDLQGAPEPAVTMVNVGGKLRPLNTGTNTLMDKPGYGLEQKGGQWREVQRGTGAASRQQSKVQVEQLIPVPKPVMANTPTGVAQLKAMPKSKNLDLINEAQYFIVNPVRSAFDRIFGKRDI